MSDVKSLLKKYANKYGEAFITTGAGVVDFDRLPTGVFNVDLMTGGGFPQGKISHLYGPKSSCKTTLALMTLAETQRNYPKKTHVWVDAEWGFDAAWAKRLGVDIDKIVMVKPDTGEDAVDAMAELVQAEDLGVLVLDSVAGVVPIAELDGDTNRAQVGGNSVLIGKLVRKLVRGLVQQSAAGRHPTIILLNQIRSKIGVMYGNPEKYPGGHALEHYINMELRLYGKDVMVKEVSAKLPALKQVNLILKKWKVPIVSTQGEFSFAQVPHAGLPAGGVPNLNTLLAYAKDYGFIVKDKQWYLESAEFPTLQSIAAYLMKDREALLKLQRKVINRAVIEENNMEVE